MALFDRFRRRKEEEPKRASAEGGDPSSELASAAEAAPTPELAGASESGSAESQGVEASRPKEGFFSRIRRGLQKTSQLLRTDIRDLFKREGRLVDDAFLDELFAILVRTDMGAGPANEIREEIAKEFRGRVVQFEDVLEVIRSKIRQLLDAPEEPIRWAAEGPTVILVVGVNGSGKTTSIAKLAHRFRQEGKSVILGAGDTFRAAAVEQLKVWAERIGVDIVTSDKPGGDPASVAFRTVERALQEGIDVAIIDTAGRLQTQKNLMQQLEKIYRVIGKQIPEAPHETLLVLDATAGQNGISQARGFSDAARCTGIVLAKLDGTAKGGVIIPIRKQFGLPVKFVGVGEKPEDLAVFRPEEFVAALFDEPATEPAGVSSSRSGESRA